jgi:lipopolysaccharide export system protein LptA
LKTEAEKLTRLLFLILHTSCFILYSFFLAEAQSEEQPAVLKMLAGEENDKGPITIESDQASFDKKAGLMTYSGHVEVRRGKIVINSDRLKGFLDEDQKEIDRLVAEGSVRVVKEDKTLQAQKAIYYHDTGEKERLELEGEPVIHIRNNSIRADKMFYYLATEKYEAKGHVKAVFYHHQSEIPSTPAVESQTSSLPITITSQDASFSAQSNTIQFHREVNVKRNDANLSAQELDVFLEKELNKIKKIVASDQVKITQKDKEISAEQGTFFEEGKKIVLTGNPVSRQGENVMSGEKIVYYLDSETVEVKKARTILHPRNTEEKSFFSPTPGM